MNTVSISKDFKQRAAKAVLSIVFFVFTYMALIALAVGLTIACGYGGIMLIAVSPSLITLLLGAGIMSIGLIVLFFLLKFIIKSNKADRSGLIEITREEEPELFSFIEEIVNEVGTKFPKHVYLSADVNASVFYNSGFWSMFLPVGKNLMIGIGLMNTITVDELKGILAHEFGHFSQRSMKVGSYVHNVNHVIHNMLYDNESFQKAVNRWASISSYITIFVVLGVRVIMGIQWVLKQVYQVVNLNYLALSREMEFHADEVAANVAGSQPLVTSLLRAGLAGNAYTNVLNFYGTKVRENHKPANIFPQHQFAMECIARNFNLTFRNDLPLVTLADTKRLKKSKLEFDDQWSSHPSDEDRINRLTSLGIETSDSNTANALTIFKNKERIQETVTEILFSNVFYSGNTTVHTAEHFREEFIEGISKNTLNKKYNSFYDELPLGNIDFDTLTIEEHIKEENLFDTNTLSTVHDYIGLENDIAVLNQIAAGGTSVKTFDYDGNRYKAKETKALLEKLQIRLHDVKNTIAKKETKALGYYYRLAITQGKGSDYKEKYNAYHQMQKKAEEYNEIVNLMYTSTTFLNETLEFPVINVKMNSLYSTEKAFKDTLKEIQNLYYYKEVNPEIQDAFTKYLSQEWTYFAGEMYNEAALGILFNSLNQTNVALGEMLFATKKDFLDFQAGLSMNLVN
ncbi:M48 family metalloprotease [Flavobacterium salilacus subsp. salilacus]|uniref:M48 family metalloprotease n=1 Tax=Flavobacterium TaxID=237 RepID=UPI001074B212|nr:MULTISPECIES: M48 family metallopeptidase [Flavobacterium]KAF2516884.1 M48 family metalloprotease [Flavobacterium salilacus subsp. salilacus]MBE1615756.1 M48 family metalloprotease [Flavobacterium sp. SaA2.13]